MWPFTSSNAGIIASKRAQRDKDVATAGIYNPQEHTQYLSATGMHIVYTRLIGNTLNYAQARRSYRILRKANGPLPKSSKPTSLAQLTPMRRQTVSQRVCHASPQAFGHSLTGCNLASFVRTGSTGSRAIGQAILYNRQT